MTKLSPAQRELLAEECSELSLEGLSFREIARRKGLSHPTVSSLVSEEAARRRKASDEYRMKSLAMKMKVVERLWQELHSRPSSHAAANLGHAIRGLLSDVDKISGVIAPTQIQQKVEVEVLLKRALAEWFSRLNEEEFELLNMLTSKVEGGGTPPEVDIVALAFERYRKHGTLLKPSPPEIIEAVWEFPAEGLNGGW